MEDLNVQCSRCRNKHKESERTEVPRPQKRTGGIQISDKVCPRCRCKTYYRLETPRTAGGM